MFIEAVELLWTVEKVDFLDISVRSTRAYWEFAVGMLLFFIPSFVIAIFMGVRLSHLWISSASYSGPRQEKIYGDCLEQPLGV
jgi:hypothetical protein